MSKELGDPIDELLAARRTLTGEANIHPVDRERPTRRFGRWNYRIGLTLGICSIIGALVAAVLTEKRLFLSDNGQLFAMLTFVGVMILGGALATVGGVERNMRHHRAVVREALMNVGDMAARMSAIETAIETIAALLPEDQRMQQWRGFNDAVREGFAERTGTDSQIGRQARGRSGHLGLVQADGNAADQTKHP